MGVLLYEMLAGRPPFVADSPLEVALKHVREEPPLPSQFNPAIPTQLEAVVLRALAKDPHQRYQSAREMAAALGGYADASAAMTAAIPLGAQAADGDLATHRHAPGTQIGRAPPARA